MRKYHVALGKPMDLEKLARDAAAGGAPPHAMWNLSQKLDAQVHQPRGNPISINSTLRARIISKPEQWAMARALAGMLGADDVIYCTGEDVGIPIGSLCGGRSGGPRIISLCHNVDRPRGRVALKAFGLRDRIQLFLANAQPQYDFLRSYLKLPQDRVRMLLDQTDTTFFRPGPPTPGKKRPIITGVGLALRDYRTLAAATHDLDVDVKVSGFSPDVKAMKDAFPEKPPANFHLPTGPYPWPELVQLYRDADIVAVTLVDNKYTAGITTLLEGMACRRPVVVTRTQGLGAYFDRPGTLSLVNPGDVAGVRDAIVALLKNPSEAEAMAQRGYELVQERHTTAGYIEQISRMMATV